MKEKDDKIEALEKQLMDEALIVDELNLEYSKSPIICQETIKQTRVNASNYEAMYITKDCGYVKNTIWSLHFGSLQETELKKLQTEYDKVNANAQKLHIDNIKVWNSDYCFFLFFVFQAKEDVAHFQQELEKEIKTKEDSWCIFISLIICFCISQWL